MGCPTYYVGHTLFVGHIVISYIYNLMCSDCVVERFIICLYIYYIIDMRCKM